MFRHFQITAMDQRLVSAGAGDPCFGIVWHGDSRHALEKAIAMAVRADPGGQLHIQERFGIGPVAGPQHRHKHKRRTFGAILGVMNGHCHSRPIHKHLLSGSMNLAQYRIELVRPLTIKLAVLAVTVAFRIVLTILPPQQLQRHPLAAKFLMDFGPQGKRARCFNFWGRGACPHKQIL